MAAEIDIASFQKECKLLISTSPEWGEAVLKNFHIFVSDHAANERKAAATCMDFVVRYPNRLELVSTAARIAEDELSHFREVFEHMKKYGYELLPDEKDVYVAYLRQYTRGPSEERLMDRLLMSSLIEMRGTERFEMLSKIHPDETWKSFYKKLYLSEKGHGYAFYHEALKIFPRNEVNTRFQELLKKRSRGSRKNTYHWKISLKTTSFSNLMESPVNFL